MRTISDGYSGVWVRTCWKSSTPAINPCRISASLKAWAATLRPRACASSTIAFISSGVNASALITLIQSTPASTNWLVFALASAAPETFHVWTAFGFPPLVSAGPATYSAGPGISPLAMRLLTARIGCGGAARSRARRHAGHQHLLGRRGHDDPLELRRVGVEPIARVRMTRVHQMDVEIPQPGEHGEPFRGHALVAVRHRQRNGRFRPSRCVRRGSGRRCHESVRCRCRRSACRQPARAACSVRNVRRHAVEPPPPSRQGQRGQRPRRERAWLSW